MLLAGSMYGYCIGAVCDIVSNQDLATQEYVWNMIII